MSTASLLAGVQPNNPDWGKAGPMALFVLLLFIVSCVFLFRSMTRRIRGMPSTFDQEPQLEPQRLGTARPVIPPRTTDDSFAARDDPPPRLGTPDDLLGEEKAKRQERIRQAKARKGKGNTRRAK